MFTFSRALWGLSAIALVGPTFLQSQTTTNTIYDFGTVAVGASSTAAPLSITAPANATFTLSYGTEFAVAAPSCASGVCTVPVTFRPAFPGIRRGAISAFSGGTLLSVTPIVGVATAPTLATGTRLISTAASNTTTLSATTTPFGVAVRSAGQLFVADSTNNQIYAIDPRSGQSTRVAGTGSTAAGFSGDGGPATSAQLSAPSALALDSSGNLLIADTGNNCIRKLDLSTGTISTVAGTGSGAAGLSGDNGLAVNARLNQPAGLAVARNGDIYIADTNNHLIRQVSAASGVITTIAGSTSGGAGVPGFSGDGGPATSATLQFPISLAVDGSNNVYIADSINHVIRQVNSSNIITTVAGQGGVAGSGGNGGPATSAQLNIPTGVAVDGNGTLFIADRFNNAIRQVSADGSHTISIVAGSGTSSQGYSGDGGPASSALLTRPTYLFLDSAGNLFFVDYGNSAVRRVSVSNGLYFKPVNPCRLVDTRTNDGFSGGVFTSGSKRTFALKNSPNCPSTILAGDDVRAYSLNVTVLPRGVLDFVTVAPSVSGVPNFSTLNSRDGRTKANAAIVPANLTDNNRTIDVYATDNTDLILDINGYFVPQDTASALAYFPLPPCRLADTRSSGGIFAAGETREFTMQGSCGIPAAAQAYSLNFAVLPPGTAPVPFITTWPTGQQQPVVSTLNAYTGAVTANAAIVPGGTSGNISVFAQASTNLIIDVSGYYAPANSASGALSLYNISPCRAYDSRAAGGGSPINGVFSTEVENPCGVSGDSQSVVLNATVVPVTSLLYITLWAHNATQPVQSTLNAFDAAVTSNLAVVPTTDGQISAFTAAPTALIYDLFGYFAP